MTGIDGYVGRGGGWGEHQHWFMSVCWWREDHAEREKLGEIRGGVGEGWGSTSTGSCPFVGGEKTRERS